MKNGSFPWNLIFFLPFFSPPLFPPKTKIAQKSITFHLEVLPGSLMDVRVQLSWSAGGWMVFIVILSNLKNYSSYFLSLPFHCTAFPPLEERTAEFLLQTSENSGALTHCSCSPAHMVTCDHEGLGVEPQLLSSYWNPLHVMVKICWCVTAWELEIHTNLAGSLLSSCIQSLLTSVCKLFHSLQTMSKKLKFSGPCHHSSGSHILINFLSHSASPESSVSKDWASSKS